MTYKDLFSCEGKIAVVTGGAGLVGREVVKGFHDFGARVYIADTDRERAGGLIEGAEIRYVYLDITSEDSIREAIKRISQESAKIDILVNSAYPRTEDWRLKLEEVPFESWKTNVNNQLGGYFLCCKLAAEQMKKQGGGVIINLASTYGIVAPNFSIYEGTEMTMPVAYSAIKGGVIALTRYIATYYARYNVRANVISPGGVFDNQPQPFVEKYSEKVPLGRMANPQEVVGAAIYLASNASSYVTGHNLVVDGGWTIW